MSDAPTASEGAGSEESSARLARAKGIFLRLRELSLAEREALIDDACDGDAKLRSLVLELLAGDVMPLPVEAIADDIRAAQDSVLASPLLEPQGSMIDRYRLLERLGEGGFGVVFAAEQTHPVQRRVGLKIIKLGMDTRAVIARFEAERQALAMLDHPNIAKVFDAGTTKTGRPYFVMELVKGEPIVEYCDKNSLSIQARLELFMQVCSALQHAHTKGIIHRDIKPSNILVSTLDGRPQIKVIDFGIAKATASKLTEKTIFTEHRQLIGTPEYMSPEQAEGSLDIDTRTDVYSLGVLLYELLTGTTPFSSKELRSGAYAEIQRIIREVDPPKPSTRLSSNVDTIASVAAQRRTEPKRLGSAVSGELDWIVMKALEKDRQRRYETASGLAADVQRHLSGEAITAAPPSSMYQLSKLLRKHRPVVLAGSAIFVALLIGAAAFAWQAQVARDQRDIALQAQRSEAEQRAKADAARAEAVSQEAEAKKQAAIAEAVAKFQTDMLASVDPNQLPRDPVTNELLRDGVKVIQAVEAAIKKLDAGSLKDQPMVEARVRDTIGNTLSALGRNAEAERVLRKSLELRRGVLPGAGRDLAQSLNNLAAVLHALNKPQEAETLYREALEICRKSLPPGHLETASTLNNLGVLLKVQNNLGEAESLYRESLEIRRAALPPGHMDISTVLNNLAQLLRAQNKLADAEPLYRESLQIRRDALPPGHPEIAKSLDSLANLLQDRNKLADAEPLYRESLEIRRAALPAGHPEIAKAVSNLATLLHDQNRLAEAEPLYWEALAIERTSLPPGDKAIGSSLNNLADYLRAQNRLSEAEPLFREALEIFRATHPAGHPNIAIVLSNYGALKEVQVQYDEAESMFRESLAIARGSRPAGHPSIAASLTRLANLLQRQNKLTEAEPLRREALEIYRAALPPRHPNIATALNGLALLLLSKESYSEAEPLFREALDIRREALPAGHSDIAGTLSNLATVQGRLGRTAEARAGFDEALATLRAGSPDGSALLARVLWRSGTSRLDGNQALAALPELEEAVLMAQRYLKPQDPQLAEYRETLAKCKALLAR
jgi:eukaryotic-like serine/threonine-protein kinase